MYQERCILSVITSDLASTPGCTFLKGFVHICVANCTLSLHIFVCYCSVCLVVAACCRRDQKISGPGNSIKPAHYHSSRICSTMTNSTRFATTFALMLFSVEFKPVKLIEVPVFFFYRLSGTDQMVEAEKIMSFVNVSNNI